MTLLSLGYTVQVLSSARQSYLKQKELWILNCVKSLLLARDSVTNSCLEKSTKCWFWTRFDRFWRNGDKLNQFTKKSTSWRFSWRFYVRKMQHLNLNRPICLMKHFDNDNLQKILNLVPKFLNSLLKEDKDSLFDFKFFTQSIKLYHLLNIYCSESCKIKVNSQ